MDVDRRAEILNKFVKTLINMIGELDDELIDLPNGNGPENGDFDEIDELIEALTVLLRKVYGWQEQVNALICNGRTRDRSPINRD
jgi:hypothetical protein